MRDFTPSPTCEKCATTFKLTAAGDKTRNIFGDASGQFIAVHHVQYIGLKLVVTCPVCGNRFDMHPADHQPERVQNDLAPE